MNTEIILVSGLPRSGTSLMMQMLDRGGIEVVTDEIRVADTDNPRGYFELEKVKKLKQDATWLPQARGRGFKIVSQLLYDLPASERFRIVFMERDYDEMLDSQEKMLARLGRPAAPRDQIAKSFHQHVTKLKDWLARQPNMAAIFVNYNDLLEQPIEQTRRVADFLGRPAAAESMTAAIDPALYRNRVVRAS